ncbi:HET-domain-containing protein, partial [Setomelanomma holmii]
ACLSHCWGKKGAALQLTPDTVDTLRSGVARAELPKTFRDAAEIFEKLGIHFLWIDAMCIAQDNLEDWASAASVMADIYEGAYLTIAATSSNNSNGGCFSRFRNRIRDFGSGNTMTDWPLLRRGWVCQERRLSTRVIHYAKDQLFWECDTAFHSESDPQDWTSGDRGTLKNLHDDPGQSWRSLVEIYSRLKFTKKGDHLPALAGIVEREARRRKDDTYVAGMWRNTLLDDLGFSPSRRRVYIASVTS